MKQGATKGTLGLDGPPNGSAFLSAFRYRADDTLAIPPPPPRGRPARLLVSHHEGRLFRVALPAEPGGEATARVTKLLDTSVKGVPLASFAWIADEGLAVLPTFTDDRVMAYRLPPG